MGSSSDWETMRHAHDLLMQLDIPHECRIVSAHRTPDWTADYAKTAVQRGLHVIIAGAGGAAHLPGMTASMTALPTTKLAPAPTTNCCAKLGWAKLMPATTATIAIDPACR